MYPDDSEELPAQSIMTGDAKRPPGVGPRPEGQRGIVKFKPIHVHALELLLVDPTLSNRQLAKELGRSEQMVCTLVNSDIFRAALEECRDERKANIQLGMMDKLRAVQDKALSRMYKLVESSFDLKDVTRAADVALRAGGYGPKREAPQTPTTPQVNNNMFIQLPSEVFSRAQSNFGKAKPVIEHEPNDS